MLLRLPRTLPNPASLPSASRISTLQLAGALADTFLLFSSAKHAGTALEAVGFEPTDAAVNTFWQLSEATLRSAVQVSRCGCLFRQPEAARSNQAGLVSYAVPT